MGYCVYYNVFVNKFVPNATKMIGGVMELELGITNPKYIGAAIEYTAGGSTESQHPFWKCFRMGC